MIQSNGVEIRINVDPAVTIHIDSSKPTIKKSITGAITNFANTPTIPPAKWITGVEQAGFVQLDKKVIAEKKLGITVPPIQFDLRVAVAGIAADDEETEVLFLVFNENEKGQIQSVQLTDSKGHVRNILESGHIEFKTFVSHSLFDFPKSTFRIFCKTIKKVKGVLKDIVNWDNDLRQLLYDATDHLFFKPKDDLGFSLKYFDSKGKTEKLDTTKKEQMREGLGLLFIHGIFSEIRDAFKGLTAIPKNSNGAPTLSETPLRTLHGRYHGRIYGFDHATFSKDSVENARELIDSLPRGVELDLICHSRGGQVTRCLLEHPDIILKANEKNIRFRKVLIVAGACEGSPLAGDRFLNTFLLTCTALSLIPSIKILSQLLETLAKFAHNAPGVTCLDPENSTCIKAIDGNIKENTSQELAFCRANFDPGDSLPKEILDEIVIDIAAFAGKPNDWIVPFAGANISQKYADQPKPKIIEGLEFGTATRVQNTVYHLNYFYQQKIQEKILSFFA
jgi:hypothetical protein